MPGSLPVSLSPAAQLRTELEEAIAARRLGPGTKLPSERELSERFGIHRNTVQKSLARLEAEGLIYRLDRSGWYVSAPRFLYDPTKDVSFTENARSQGREPGSSLLETREVKARTEMAQVLGVRSGTTIYRIRRLRLLEERPVFVEESNVLKSRCPGLPAIIDRDVSLARLYREEFGIHLRRQFVRMHPTALGPVEAEHLRVASGAPGLFLARLSADDSGEPVGFDREYWRHDALEIVVNVGAGGLRRASR